VLLGAKGKKGEGCGGPINSRSPAPEMTGAWDIFWDDGLDVEIKLGGAVHTARVGSRGGSVTIDHAGQPITFDLDCERPEVVCPSEVWPGSVSVEHRNANFPHRIFVRIPRQICRGDLVSPDECGPGTINEDCDDVCDGEVDTVYADRFGVIGETGSHFDLLLGAGIASNGINCALLGLSAATADLVNVGSQEEGDWEAVAMQHGEVAAGYAGGCLWAGDPDGDGKLQALVLGATVKLTTGFTGTKR